MQKIANLLNSSGNQFSKFATKNGALLTVNQMVVIRNKVDGIKSL